MNSSSVVFVDLSAFAMDSVDGHRALPTLVTRLDLLNVVGSRPDFLANPEGVRRRRSANASIAAQTASWDSMVARYLPA